MGSSYTWPWQQIEANSLHHAPCTVSVEKESFLLLCELTVGLNTLQNQQISCRRREAQQRMWGCSAHSPATVQTSLRGYTYSTACFPHNCSPVLFPKLPDCRLTLRKWFADEKNPTNFGLQYCSEHCDWDRYRNLQNEWFQYSRGSKQSTLLRRNRMEMKPPYGSYI
jgi:hypothetical protein